MIWRSRKGLAFGQDQPLALGEQQCPQDVEVIDDMSEENFITPFSSAGQ
jgi:hypothetical protein